MIANFRHKGLGLLYKKVNQSRVPPELVAKVERILSRLDVVTTPTDMNLPGWRLHPLKGNLAGFWSVSVTGNWRIIFRFNGVDACDVDLIDYH